MFFLKNRDISSKIKRAKVTDYAALTFQTAVHKCTDKTAFTGYTFHTAINKCADKICIHRIYFPDRGSEVH